MQRTQRKFAIHIPPKIADRFERDTTSGPNLFVSPVSSRFRTFTWDCEGVSRSGSLSEDIVVREQVMR